MPEEYNRDYIRIRGTVLGGRYKIANVCGTLGEDGQLAEECRANARLIAASPDLFEALAGILEECGSDLPSWRKTEAETAIQKATIGDQ